MQATNATPLTTFYVITDQGETTLEAESLAAAFDQAYATHGDALHGVTDIPATGGN